MLQHSACHDDDETLVLRGTQTLFSSSLPSSSSSSIMPRQQHTSAHTCWYPCAHRRVDSSYLPSQGMQSLAVLRADNNQLQGNLPGDWGAAHNLSVLSLHNNALPGALPAGVFLYVTVAVTVCYCMLCGHSMLRLQHIVAVTACCAYSILLRGQSIPSLLTPLTGDLGGCGAPPQCACRDVATSHSFSSTSDLWGTRTTCCVTSLACC